VRGRELVDAILAGENGVIAIGKYRSLRSTVWRLVRAGILARLYPGVYAMASDVERTGTWLTGLFAWKPDAVISGATALALHRGELPSRIAAVGRIEAHRAIRTRDSARVRWQRRSHPPESRVSDGGVTALTRVAVAVERAAHDDGRAIDDVFRLRQGRPEDLVVALAAYSYTRGNPVRRRVVAASETRPYSFGERELHRVLRAHSLTDWVANEPIRVGGEIVIPDVRIRGHRVVIEFDGREFHSDAVRFEHDRRRQNLLVRHGFLVLRFTWAMLRDDPAAVVAIIRDTCRHAQRIAS
jgi:very-short-patch-repair endonuclease